MASELMNITEDKLFPFGGINLKQVNKRTSEPRLGFKPLAFFHNWSMLYLIGLHMLAFTTKNCLIVKQNQQSAKRLYIKNWRNEVLSPFSARRPFKMFTNALYIKEMTTNENRGWTVEQGDNWNQKHKSLIQLNKPPCLSVRVIFICKFNWPFAELH